MKISYSDTLSMISLIIGVVSLIIAVNIYKISIKTNLSRLKTDFILNIYKYRVLDNRDYIFDKLIFDLKQDVSMENINRLKEKTEESYKYTYASILILQEILEYLEKYNNTKLPFINKWYYSKLYKLIRSFTQERLKLLRYTTLDDGIDIIETFVTVEHKGKLSEETHRIINESLDELTETYMKNILVKCKTYNGSEYNISITELAKILIDFLIDKRVYNAYVIDISSIIQLLCDDITPYDKLICFLEWEQTKIKKVKLRIYFKYMYRRIKKFKHNINLYRYRYGLKCDKKFKNTLDELNNRNEKQVEH